jgi:hypothetical protein
MFRSRGNVAKSIVGIILSIFIHYGSPDFN